MKIANVLPGSLLDPILGDKKRFTYHLILAHACLDKITGHKYADWYRHRIKQQGDFVILDNGAYEFGVSQTISDLIQAAKMIGPTEIVLPDDMSKGGDENFNLALSGSYDLRQEGYNSFMAVPHGDNVMDWLHCARRMAHIPGVGCIGIAEKDAIKFFPGLPIGRQIMVQLLRDLDVDIHLLGMMEDMRDIQSPIVREAVRGVDGSKLVVWGLSEINVNPVSLIHSPINLPPYPGRPDDYFGIRMNSVSPSACAMIRNNIQGWEDYVSSR